MPMPSPDVSFYCCPDPACHRAALIAEADGLRCTNGHVFPFASGTDVPVFAEAATGGSEYSVTDAAELHDNALRWLFKTFRTDEATLRRRLIERLDLAPGQSLLVTGAGAGNDLPYLAERMRGRGTIYAQDIARPMLLAGAARHQGTLRDMGIDARFSISDATQLPFADGAFDAAYHFGGINLFPDIGAGITEMNRVVRLGGKIVIADEGLAPWLRNAEIGKQLIANNTLYAYAAPLEHLPETARDAKLSWELHNCFYVIEFVVGDTPLPIDIDVPHVGRRGGSIRTRYFGQLEGVDPQLKEAAYAEAERRGLSRVEFLEELLLAATRGRTT